MIFDLHTHSTLSDDSRASVEQYIKWITVLRRKGYNIDGFDTYTNVELLIFHLCYV